MTILPRTFYERDTVVVARELLGKKIIRTLNGKKIEAIITETEAYRSDDPACHAFRGKTPRNSALFETVGHTYVYICYGIHHCLNFVSRDISKFPSGGVLIRAVYEVGEGRLISGPGNVAKFLGINKLHGQIDITNPNSEIFVAEGLKISPKFMDATPRIGISVAIDVPWRFIIRQEKFLLLSPTK